MQSCQQSRSDCTSGSFRGVTSPKSNISFLFFAVRQASLSPLGAQLLWAGALSGFRKRGLANGVSPFFSENEMEKTEENGKKTERNGKKGKKRKKTERKQGKNRKKKKKKENGRKQKKKKIESDTVPATPFAKLRL